MKCKFLLPTTLCILAAVAIPIHYSLKTKYFEVEFKKGGLLDPDLYKKNH